MEYSTVVIPQSPVTTAPYTILTVFINELHNTTCNPFVLQMVEICSVVPADAIFCTDPQPILDCLVKQNKYAIMNKTILFGKILERISVEAANAVVPCGEPEITLRYLRQCVQYVVPARPSAIE